MWGTGRRYRHAVLEWLELPAESFATGKKRLVIAANKTSRWIGRTALALVALAVLALASLGVERALDGGALHGGAAYAGSGTSLVVSEPVALQPAVPLYLDRGTLHAAGHEIVTANDNIPRLTVDGGVFRVPLSDRLGDKPLEQSRPGKDGTASEPRSLAPLLSQLASLHVTEVALTRSRVEFATAEGGTLSLTNLNGTITVARRTFFAKGTAEFKGQPVQIDAIWSPAESGRTFVPLKLSLRSSLLDAMFDGRLNFSGDLRLVGNTTIKAPRLRAIARWFGVKLAMSSDLQEASLIGPLDWSADLFSFSKASVVLDGNRAEGALVLRTSGARPAIEGTLDFKTLDLKHYVAVQMTPPEGKPAARSGSLVAAFDADLRLSAAKVIMPAFETGRGAVTISLKNGRMLADLAELEIEAGTASGQIILDVNSANPPKLAVKSRFNRIDPGRIFADGLRRNPLLGRADLTIDGQGTGSYLGEMLANFTGKGNFTVPDGGRAGIDLKALAYAAQKARNVGWQAAGKGTTQIDSLVGSLQISNGVLSLDSLHAKSGGTSYAATGKVDLKGRLLDLSVAIGDTPAAPASAIVPQDTLSIRGAWSDPAISLLGRPFTGTAPAVKGATTLLPPLPLPQPVGRD